MIPKGSHVSSPSTIGNDETPGSIVVDPSLGPILVCARFASKPGRGENHLCCILTLGAAVEKSPGNVGLASGVLEPSGSECSLALPGFPRTSRLGARPGLDHRDRFARCDCRSASEILLLCVRLAALSPCPARIVHLDSPSLRARSDDFGDRSLNAFFFTLWRLLGIFAAERRPATDAERRLHLAHSPASVVPRADLLLFRIRQGHGRRLEVGFGIKHSKLDVAVYAK